MFRMKKMVFFSEYTSVQRNLDQKVITAWIKNSCALDQFRNTANAASSRRSQKI